MSMFTTPQGSNASRSRSRNRRAVLGRLHQTGDMGRAELARSLGLSTQAVSNIIADMSADGLLVEKGTRTVGRGQPAMQYGLNPNGGFALGYEIRPDALFAALLNMHGEPVFTKRMPLEDAAPDVVLALVIGLRDAAVAHVPQAKDRLLGAGIVMPGPFGQTGLPCNGSDLPGWQSISAHRLFQDALNIPIEVSNDANAAAMAERINGVAQGIDTYGYLYFGRGLGLGLVSDGQLITGAFGNAGEIGHIPVFGSSGEASLETRLSRLSVQRHYNRQVSFDDIKALYEAQDPALMVWLIRATAALRQAVHLIENLFDPQMIILGGAMPENVMDHFVSNVRLPENSVSNRADNPHTRLRRGSSTRLTATLGAASLVLGHAYLPSQNTMQLI